jgi:hypothetical protein
MTSNQYRILRTLLEHGPRSLRHFTHADRLEQSRCAPHICEADMGKLVAAGLVTRAGNLYALTRDGAAAADLATPTPKLPFSSEVWKPSPWEPPRAGSGRMYESIGTPC